MAVKEKVQIRINEKLCKKCGICSAFCAQNVFSVSADGTPKVTASENCTNCHLCDWRCPDFAITVEVMT